MVCDVTSSILIFAGIVVVAAVIAVIAFIIYRAMHPKLKDKEEEKSDKDYAQEELDRILQPIEDEETAKQVSDYKDEDE